MVVIRIEAPASVAIFRPGEAKAEPKNALEAKRSGERITGFETVDKMSDRGIAAKVWQYFLK